MVASSSADAGAVMSSRGDAASSGTPLSGTIEPPLPVTASLRRELLRIGDDARRLVRGVVGHLDGHVGAERAARAGAASAAPGPASPRAPTAPCRCRRPSAPRTAPAGRAGRAGASRRSSCAAVRSRSRAPWVEPGEESTLVGRGATAPAAGGGASGFGPRAAWRPPRRRARCRAACAAPSTVGRRRRTAGARPCRRAPCVSPAACPLCSSRFFSVEDRVERRLALGG